MFVRNRCLQAISPRALGTYRACKDVVTRLLDKRESSRLGSMTGASEVKAHKWFAKINWGLLRNTQPPVSVTFPLTASRCEARASLGFRGRRHRHHGAGRRYAILGRELEDCSSNAILGGLGKTSMTVAVEAT